MVRASDLRLNGREFDSRPPHCQSVGTGIDGRPKTAIHSSTNRLTVRRPGIMPTRPSQPPTLCGTGNECRPKYGDALRLRAKAGWLIPFVDIKVWVAEADDTFKDDMQ